MTAKQAVCQFTRQVNIKGEMYMGYGLLSLRRGCWTIPSMYQARFKAFDTRQEARQYVRRIVSGWKDRDCCEGCYHESKAVIQELAARYPGTVDYDTKSGNVFHLLDDDDKAIATIDEREMTSIWNAVELNHTEGRVA